MSDRPIEIANRLRNIRADLDEATLIAVTKYSEVPDVVFAYDADQRDFGENRVIDLSIKADYFKEHNLNEVRWHFIGHLQTNKVKELLRIPNLYAIHSIDSIKLLEELVKRKVEFEGFRLKLFFQINTSREEEKSGFESVLELKEAITYFNSVKDSTPFLLAGLMTLGTIRTENIEEEANRCFMDLVSIKNEIENEFQLSDLKLSMGMSGDYKIALSHGSDYVRIGTSIFK